MQKKFFKYLSDTFLEQFKVVDVFSQEHNKSVVNLNNALFHKV